MLDGDDKYARQRRLAEVGDSGQARLAEASVDVAACEDAFIEASYLYRAGVGRLSIVRAPQVRPFAHATAFRFAASSAVAAGAWRALSQIRTLLQIGK